MYRVESRLVDLGFMSLNKAFSDVQDTDRSYVHISK